MARNRQRSKQRQAERRARRLEQEGVTPPDLDTPGLDPDVVDGAPPEELGRSDYTLEQEQHDLVAEQHLDDDPPATEQEAIEEIEDWEVEDEDHLADDEVEETPTGEGEAGYAVRGRRGRDPHEAHKDRPRVVQFLIACWAELQRVQWPNRQALVTLTGVVLGFVLIAGGYLGLLDAIFSELIKAIL
jgi:preprotein translocase subunit SecE